VDVIDRLHHHRSAHSYVDVGAGSLGELALELTTDVKQCKNNLGQGLINKALESLLLSQRQLVNKVIMRVAL